LPTLPATYTALVEGQAAAAGIQLAADESLTVNGDTGHGAATLAVGAGGRRLVPRRRRAHPTMKLKRRVIARKCADAIDALYGA
jgi:hypothetical protein